MFEWNLCKEDYKICIILLDDEDLKKKFVDMVKYVFEL